VKAQRAAVVAATAILIGALAVTLAWRVPDTREDPLVVYVPGMQPIALELPGPTQVHPEGPDPHRVVLATTQWRALAHYSGLRLLVADFDSGARLQSAELVVPGSGCGFRSTSSGRIPNNDYLYFRRSGDCSGAADPQDGRLELRIVLEKPARVGVWTWTQPGWVTPNGKIEIKDRRIPLTSDRPALTGYAIEELPDTATRRITLLAALWDASRISVAIALAGIAALLLASVALMPLAPTSGDSSIGNAARIGFSSALLAFAVSSAYVLLVPPFQGPDEPNHFVGIVRQQGITESQVEDWAMRDHFERLRFNAAARFRPPDAAARLPGKWRDVSATDFSQRSASVFPWSVALHLGRMLSIPGKFWLLRMVNALIFAAAVGFGAALVAWATAVPWPQLVFVPLLIAPAVPFFGMHVSNHALLVTSYVLIASGTVVLVAGGKRSDWSGWALGAGLALALASGRSAVPMIGFVAFAAAARIVGRSPQDGGRSPASFWSGIAFSAAGIPMAFGTYATQIDGIRAAHAGLAAVAMLAIVAGCAVAAMVDRRLARAARVPRPLVARWTWIIATWIAVTAIGSLFLRYPRLQGVLLEPQPSMGKYIYRALLSVVTAARLRGQDHLTSVSFWGGFGWLDRLLPGVWVTVLVMATAAAAAALGVWITRTRDEPLARRFLTLLAGAFCTLAAYAASAYRFSPDLHGRYLIGLYLPMIAVFWMPLLAAWPRRWSARTSVALTLVVAGYAAAIWFVMTSYY